MIGEPEAGWVAEELRTEFPELRVWTLNVAAKPGRTTHGLAQRLRHLSNRFSGAQAVQLRTQPVPHAYRVFLRHIGIDPDAQPTGAEAAVLDRMFHGGFRSRGLVEDALLVAVAETNVPVWAFDDGALDGPLGVRPAGARERLGRSELAPDLAPGTLVVADAAGPVAKLFADPAPGHAPHKRTEALRLMTVQVAGVPAIHVEEALWIAAEAMGA